MISCMLSMINELYQCHQPTIPRTDIQIFLHLSTADVMLSTFQLCCSAGFPPGPSGDQTVALLANPLAYLTDITARLVVQTRWSLCGTYDHCIILEGSAAVTANLRRDSEYHVAGIFHLLLTWTVSPYITIDKTEFGLKVVMLCSTL